MRYFQIFTISELCNDRAPRQLFISSISYPFQKYARLQTADAPVIQGHVRDFFQRSGSVKEGASPCLQHGSLRRQTEFRLPRSSLPSYLLAYISHALLSFRLFPVYPAQLSSMYIMMLVGNSTKCLCRFAFILRMRIPSGLNLIKSVYIEPSP